MVTLTQADAAARPHLVQLFSRLWRSRELLRELVRRDLEEAYAGSALARLWAFIHPMLLIGLYLFVFGYVFTTRLGADLPQVPDYAVYLLAGLAPWLTIQSALARGTNAIVVGTNLVKQVVFPVELLPIRSVLAAQIPLLVGLVLLPIYSAVAFRLVSPLLLLAVYPVLTQLMLLCGTALFLSALTAFLKDTRDIVQFFSSFGVFLVPVLYLPGALPGWFEAALHLNPFSYAIWCLQDVFFFQEFRHPWAWPMAGLLGVTALQLGYAFFQRTRGSFGDVL
jgi:lipopolysaccharide transport system permease protein